MVTWYNFIFWKNLRYSYGVWKTNCEYECVCVWWAGMEDPGTLGDLMGDDGGVGRR